MRMTITSKTLSPDVKGVGGGAPNISSGPINHFDVGVVYLDENFKGGGG